MMAVIFLFQNPASLSTNRNKMLIKKVAKNFRVRKNYF